MTRLRAPGCHRRIECLVLGTLTLDCAAENGSDVFALFSLLYAGVLVARLHAGAGIGRIIVMNLDDMSRLLTHYI